MRIRRDNTRGDSSRGMDEHHQVGEWQKTMEDSQVSYLEDAEQGEVLASDYRTNSKKFHDQYRWKEFGLVLLCDLLVCILTFLCIWICERPRYTRMVKAGRIRKVQHIRRRSYISTGKTFFLYLLYFQGMTPTLCQTSSHQSLDLHHSGAGETRWTTTTPQTMEMDRYQEEVTSFMAMGTEAMHDPRDGVRRPDSLADFPEVAQQDPDIDNLDQEDATTSDSMEEDIEEEDHDPPGEETSAVEQQEVEQQETRMEDEGGPYSTDEGICEEDWQHLFLFRRHHLQRHCYLRWNTYHNILRNVANTWEVARSDILHIIHMVAEIEAIPHEARKAIVVIRDDDPSFDGRTFVLVDVIWHTLVHFREGPQIHRRVLRLQDSMTRQAMLEIAEVGGYCRNQRDRCLLRLNGIRIPAQDHRLHDVRTGSYLQIDVPPLEDCTNDGINFLQTHQTVFQKVHNDGQQGNGTTTLRTGRYSVNSPCPCDRWCLETGDLFVGDVLVSSCACVIDRFWNWSLSQCICMFDRLPPPGNPETFDVTSDDEEAHQEHPQPSRIDMTITLPQNSQDLLRILQPWDPQALELDFDPNCRLSPISLQFLSECQVDSTLPMDRLYIYTDGSYLGHTGVAAFAFAVFGWSISEPHHHFLGWYGNKVQLSEQDQHYTGAAAMTAEEAEASGLILAHLWYLQKRPDLPTTFCYDAYNCGLGTSGSRNIRHEWLQGRRMREISQFLQALCPQFVFCYEHVKAHSSQPANDIVDALAKWLVITDTSTKHRVLPDWRPLFTHSDPTLTWAWWIAKALLQDTTLPPLVNGHHAWTLQDPRHGGTKIQQIEQTTPFSPHETTFDLKCATFNVLSLNAYEQNNATGDNVVAGSAALLRQQFQHGGYHLVGLQETRASSQTLLRAADFLRFVSGDTSGSGHGGCELWISRTLPWARQQEGDVFIKDKDVAVVVATPRLLGLVVRVGATRLVIYVCHAPHEGASHEQKESWWSLFHHHLQRNRHKGRHILLGDFNARLDLQIPGHTGDRIFDPPSDNGQRFQSCLQDQRFWLPSTYSDFHVPPDCTWTHPKGTVSRLDYIAIDADVTWQVLWSGIDTYIQATHRAMDHSAVGLRVRWYAEDGHCPPQPRHIDWEAMHTQEGSRKLDEILDSMPRVSWDTDVHQHWQLLQDHLDRGLEEHFSLSRRPKRSDIFTDDTWRQLERRRRYKQCLLDWDSVTATFHLRMAVEQWRHGAPLSMVRRKFILQLVVLHLSRLFLLREFHDAATALRDSVKKDKADFIDQVVDTANTATAQDLHHLLKPLRISSAWRKKPQCPLPQLEDPSGDTLDDAYDIDCLWRDHCAKLEAGTITTTQRLLQRIRKKSFLRAQQQPHSFLTEVPSLTSLEAAFRRIKCRKSPGNDAIRSDICHLKPASLAACYFPILAKMHCQVMEPIQMKGGTMISAYKGGSSRKIDNFRGLLLSSHVGKALRRTVRQSLVPYYVASAPNTHFSIRTGGNVTHASFALRTFLQAASHRGWSTATLFLDVKSAFYRVIRQLATQVTNSDEDVCRVLAYFAIDPEDMPDLWEEIRRPSECQTSAIPPRMEAVLEELMSGTWFTTPSKRHLVEVMAGSRPGDGLADIVFGFIFKRIMARVRATLQQYVDWWTIDGDLVSNFDLREEPPHPPLNTCLEVVWADDLAFSVAGSPATEVAERISIVAKEIITLCLKHALQPNLKRGKTEILFCLKGAKSRQLKRDIFGQIDPDFYIEQAPSGYERIKVTAQYKHLGSQLHVTTQMMPELRVRLGQAAAIFRQHRRSIFQNPKLTLTRRRFLFNSLVNSVLTYNMGSWPELSRKENKYLQARLYSMYRSLARATVGESELRMWNTRRLLAFVDLPSVELLLRAHRLRFAITLGKSGPPELWHLLAAEQHWLQRLRQDFEWMQHQLNGWGPDKQGNHFLIDMNYTWFATLLELRQHGFAGLSDMLLYRIRFVRTGWSGTMR